MKVTMMNIAEGARTLQDVNGRPHSFPCGEIAEIDLPDAHAKIFKNVSPKATMMMIPEGVTVDDKFRAMMAMVRNMSNLTYQEALGQARAVFGLNGMRQRPQLSEIRAKAARIATAYAMAGFTNFDQIMKLESTRTDDPDVADAGGMHLDTMAAMKRNVRLNVPRHVLAQEAQRAAYADILTEEPSSDPRAAKREILGRIPTALPLHAAMNQPLPTATPGEFEDDDRDPEQIAADIEAGRSSTRNANSLRPAADDEDDDGEPKVSKAKQARNARANKSPARAPGSAKKVAKKAKKVSRR